MEPLLKLKIVAGPRIAGSPKNPQVFIMPVARGLEDIPVMSWRFWSHGLLTASYQAALLGHGGVLTTTATVLRGA